MKRPPRLYFASASGTIFCATVYRERPREPGMFDVATKYDVTQEAVQSVVALLDRGDSVETNENGERFRLRVVRERMDAPKPKLVTATPGALAAIVDARARSTRTHDL